MRSRPGPAVVLAAGSVVSRVLGFTRALLLVAALGATTAAPGGQIFDVANALPGALYALLAGGTMSAVLVPGIVKALEEDGEARARIGSLLTAIGVLGGLATVAALAFAPHLITLYAAAWPTTWSALGTQMALWCLPQLLFLVLFVGYSQVLTASERYAAVSWAPVLSNVVTLAGLCAFVVSFDGLVPVSEWTTPMVAVLCGAFTAGAAAQALLVAGASWRAGHWPRLRGGIRHLGTFRAQGTAAGWTLLGIIAWQLSYIMVSNVCSSAGAALTVEGQTGAGLNTLSAAYLLALIPQGILVVPIVTVAYTELTRAWQKGDDAHALDILRSRGLTLALTLGAASAALALLAGPLCRAVWDAEVAAPVLAALAPGMAAQGLLFLLQRASLALGDPVSPFVGQAVVAVVTTVGCVAASLLVPPSLVVTSCAAVLSGASVAGLAVGAILLRPVLGRRGRSHGTDIATRAGLLPLGWWRVLPRSALVVSAAAGGSLLGILGDQYLDPWLGGRGAAVAGGAVGIVAAAGLAAIALFSGPNACSRAFHATFRGPGTQTETSSPRRAVTEGAAVSTGSHTSCGREPPQPRRIPSSSAAEVTGRRQTPPRQ